MRLTEGMRSKIQKAFIDAIFNPKFEALTTEERQIGDDIFKTATVEKDRKRWDAEPQGDFPEITSCRAQFEHGHYSYIYFSRSVRVGHSFNNKSTILIEDQALKTRHQDWQLKKEKCESEKKELSRKITSALNSVNTDKQLLDVWPECAPYIPASMVNLPAVVVTEIRNEINNAMLGGAEA